MREREQSEVETPEHACPLVAVWRRSRQGAGNAAADSSLCCINSPGVSAYCTSSSSWRGPFISAYI